jgi:hypothetical protein
MGVNVGSIPNILVAEIMQQLITSEPAQADTICTRRTDRSTLAGSIPVLQSITTLARAEDVGVGPFAEVADHGGSMTTAAYNCLARVGKSLISDEEINDMGALGQDAIALHLGICRAVANFKTDFALATALTSGSLNGTFNCNSDGAGEWDDKTNGTPLEDLLKASRTFAPDADTLVIGRRVAEALMSQPDIKAESSMFSAGQLDYNSLEAYLRRKIPNIRFIHILDKLYNTNALGQTPAVSRLFEINAWLGYKRDLILVEPAGAPIQNKVEQERQVSKRATLLQYERYNDVLRPSASLGVRFTNVITGGSY